MRYILALVIAVLVTLGLEPVATARVMDPVEVTFPDIATLNPEHTPYVVEIHDPQPELGDLFVVANPGAHRAPAPHDGSATVPLSLVEGDNAFVAVVRCAPSDGPCTAIAGAGPIALVRELQVDMVGHAKHPLGTESRVPVDEVEPSSEGTVAHLAWSVTDAEDPSTTIVSDEADWAVGDVPPEVGIPGDTTAERVLVTVTASTDTGRWGHLEGVGSQTYEVDLLRPDVQASLSADTVFPLRDGYRDRIYIDFHYSDTRDLDRLVGEVVDKKGVAKVFMTDGWQGATFDGKVGRRQLPAGGYVLRFTAYDYASNRTVLRYPIRVDGRRLVQRNFSRTYSAVGTVVDRFVGDCSNLGPAAGRGWKGSLGLYSGSPCRARNGSVVATVHEFRLPRSLGPYGGIINMSMYGGAALGSSSAYIVHGWLRASDGDFIRRGQWDGELGEHTGWAPDEDVVRVVKGQGSVALQIGLSEGSRYDVKNFTISGTYGALVPDRSRTASDAKTIAEPSGAPGPGYTPPKTDAVELLEAYSPGM